FAMILSIELDDVLFEEAQRRFTRYPNVSILHGDSGHLLKEILPSLVKPTLFWLDGHYCGTATARSRLETPVLHEVTAILTHRVRDHVILIDDARCFDGTHDYPTIDELKREVLNLRPDWVFEVSNDIIRAHRGS